LGKGIKFMNLSFKDKVALVIGAGSGMGLAAAQAFAAEGAAVALVDTNESAVRTAAEKLALRDIKPSPYAAKRIIAMSRHAPRQTLAREFGATDIVTKRGDEGVARIMELTNGVGADSVLECVGTQESMMQAINSSRKGGYVSYVGVPHGVELNGEQLFFSHVHLHGGPAPVRRYLPDLIKLVLDKKINPGKVF
jgi:threonine dehydrogenase-like Zn-dependent dehydrogenase